MTRQRFWLWWRIDGLRIKAETTRGHYRKVHAETFPGEHGEDCDPPDDPDWWHAESIRPAVSGWRSDGKWAVLLPAVWKSNGGYIEQDIEQDIRRGDW